jgi:GPH family glycoside/pentoside/hexuronide:cation symporter
MNTSKLTKREIAGYGVGDMGFNFYWTNIATFLLIFYTDVFGISAAAAATMLFTVKLANAVTDPLIGAIARRRAGASSAPTCSSWRCRWPSWAC